MFPDYEMSVVPATQSGTLELRKDNPNNYWRVFFGWLAVMAVAGFALYYGTANTKEWSFWFTFWLVVPVLLILFSFGTIRSARSPEHQSRVIRFSKDGLELNAYAQADRADIYPMADLKEIAFVRDGNLYEVYVNGTKKSITAIDYPADRLLVGTGAELPQIVGTMMNSQPVKVQQVNNVKRYLLRFGGSSGAPVLRYFSRSARQPDGLIHLRCAGDNKFDGVLTVDPEKQILTRKRSILGDEVWPNYVDRQYRVTKMKTVHQKYGPTLICAKLEISNDAGNFQTLMRCNVPENRGPQVPFWITEDLEGLVEYLKSLSLEPWEEE